MLCHISLLLANVPFGQRTSALLGFVCQIVISGNRYLQKVSSKAVPLGLFQPSANNRRRFCVM